MNNSFDDIVSKLGIPHWYDVSGYPRYCKFHPKEVASIYASFCCLVKVGCQGCTETFNVSVYYDPHELLLRKLRYPYEEMGPGAEAVATSIQSENPQNPFDDLKLEDWAGLVSYGDPPNHNCVGDTMGSLEQIILECWMKVDHQWKRFKKYEIKLEES